MSTQKKLDDETRHFLEQCCRFTNLGKQGKLTEERKYQLTWNFAQLTQKLKLDGKVNWGSIWLSISTNDYSGLFCYFDQLRREHGVEIPANYSSL